jgi:hypothetical protein
VNSVLLVTEQEPYPVAQRSTQNGKGDKLMQLAGSVTDLFSITDIVLDPAHYVVSSVDANRLLSEPRIENIDNASLTSSARDL